MSRMGKSIVLNELTIDADQVELSKVEVGGQSLYQLKLAFKVTHKDYHDVTVELYKNDFLVKVENVEFYAEIQHYATSVTNLYEEDAIGDFSLTLMEKSN